ncbi:hypothetical protein BN7_2842 [Wickerhamomyces ciferrii]|uniref:Transcription regulator Rua1 C-terminal domain-containing protein n=1 Tax=Wickerhamomyces ciferrii (strain ATCC 14091 / BCRC 22168 / CBS 111 / JCM 3599 / NBRC 0793 / NRRL Y-1031 F-60-10) TaxID=1206466 RepID=K0KPK5_WICCF|nr:uncharacterized protein BN7_2842 [Wickerhamomyces ciferrii]CCH43294.1 hypothetical protein BN7_2842 [Wickerhamomyces ciferrii]
MSTSLSSLDWKELNVALSQGPSILDHEYSRLHRHYRYGTGIDAIDAVDGNSGYNNNHFNGGIGSYRKEEINWPFEELRDGTSVLFNYFYSIPDHDSQKKRVEALLKIMNDDYERHLRERHCVYTKGLKAPQPHIGNKLNSTDDVKGLQVNGSPELKITCPYHSKTDHGEACLASFSFDERSEAPFAEYFTHFYQSHVLNQKKSPWTISWSDISINTFQKLNGYTDDIEQFNADFTLVTGLNAADAGIGENPLLNNCHYPCNVSLLKERPTNPRARDPMEFLSFLCPFCIPSFKSKNKKADTFFDVSNGDYERHLRERHGFYTNGKKAPQPYIGDTLIFRDDGNGSPVNEKPELTITCPHHLKSARKQSCLASFLFNKDSQAPFAEYFTHYFQTHMLQKEEPSWTSRYRPRYLSGVDESNKKIDTNYFIPIDPSLHVRAFVHQLKDRRHKWVLQPFILPPLDDERLIESKKRIENLPKAKSLNLGKFYDYHKIYSLGMNISLHRDSVKFTIDKGQEKKQEITHIHLKNGEVKRRNRSVSLSDDVHRVNGEVRRRNRSVSLSNDIHRVNGEVRRRNRSVSLSNDIHRVNGEVKKKYKSVHPNNVKYEDEDEFFDTNSTPITPKSNSAKDKTILEPGNEEESDLDFLVKLRVDRTKQRYH